MSKKIFKITIIKIIDEKIITIIIKDRHNRQTDT